MPEKVRSRDTSKKRGKETSGQRRKIKHGKSWQGGGPCLKKARGEIWNCKPILGKLNERKRHTSHLNSNHQKITINGVGDVT